MSNLLEALNSAITALRQNSNGGGFSELTEFLQKYHQEAKDGKISADSKKVNSIFQEVLAAQAKRDNQNLADILEFQLRPLLC